LGFRLEGLLSRGIKIVKLSLVIVYLFELPKPMGYIVEFFVQLLPLNTDEIYRLFLVEDVCLLTQLVKGLLNGRKAKRRIPGAHCLFNSLNCINQLPVFLLLFLLKFSLFNSKLSKCWWIVDKL
jgi:hypothetical protein